MKFLDKLNTKILSEDLECPCKMFWCIPKLTDSNDVEWDTVSFDSDGDDLSNWIIVTHQLKQIWDKDFSPCKDNYRCLPRGIMMDGRLYHGNNMPKSLDLSSVASALGGSLGKDITPIYQKDYGIDKEDLSKLEQIIGRKLGLQYTL